MVRKKKCVICDRYVDKQNDPFCSKRCRDIDLGKWITGSYSISSEENTRVPSMEKPGSKLN